MNVLTHCPWCKKRLNEKTGEKVIYRACHNLECLVENENRFKMTSVMTDYGLMVRDVSFILDTHIVKIYFFSGSTQIFPYEILEYEMPLSEGNEEYELRRTVVPGKTPIMLNTALELDFEDVERIEKKIKTYVTFS